MSKSKSLLASILLPAALAAQLASAAGAPQAPEAHYRAFDSKGRAVKIEEIVASLGDADVLIVGETHDDRVAHTCSKRRRFETPRWPTRSPSS